MKPIDIEELYNKTRDGRIKYDEERHCKLVLKEIIRTGRVSAFCVAALVSEISFWSWVKKYPKFAAAYGLAKVFAQEGWENEPFANAGNEDWDRKEWLGRGSRYFAQNKEKIVVKVDEDATPWEHYQQIMKQAGSGDFTASEIKQLMESINVGTRVFESFKLQKEVDKMKEDLSEMSQRSGDNSIPINEATNAYQNSISD